MSGMGIRWLVLVILKGFIRFDLDLLSAFDMMSDALARLGSSTGRRVGEIDEMEDRGFFLGPPPRLRLGRTRTHMCSYGSPRQT